MTVRANSEANKGLAQGFKLGAIRVDPLTGEVSGPGGREKLDPKVMDVLVFMAQHAGKVVSREDLLAKLWPDTIVTDDALTRCFYELRRQRSLAGGGEEYRSAFETLPKRGYRFNGEVTRNPQSPDRRQGGRRKRGRSDWPRQFPLLLSSRSSSALALLNQASSRSHRPPQLWRTPLRCSRSST